MTDGSELGIDVVIPTYNRWELTVRCLELLSAETLPCSTTVVDNGSSDGTPEKVQASFPDVRVVELGGNAGFSVACNTGAAGGNGDVVVLLNNDVEVRPDFLEQLVAPLADDPRLGSSAALLLQPGEQTIDSLGLTADRTLAGFPRLRGHPRSEAMSPSSVLAGPCGGAAAYRRCAWEEVGGLDEAVRFYGEDLDLALRLRSAGWGTIGVPTAVAVHLGSATVGVGSAWARRQSGFSRGYFLRRYRALGARALATEAIVALSDAVLSRDLEAGRGRVDGWRAGRGASPAAMPPADAIDASIGFVESLRLRRRITRRVTAPAPADRLR